MTQSGICDAICNVREDELQEIEDLVKDLTRQLRVAVGVRDALDGSTQSGIFTIKPADVPLCECTAPSDVTVTVQRERKKPGRKPRQVAELTRKPREAKAPIVVTEKAIQVGKMLQRRGPMTKDELADALGWRFQQVAMVIGRSAKHFVHTEEGKFDVGPALAKLL